MAEWIIHNFYILGSLENTETELLSETIYIYRNHIFWSVFLSIVLSISFVSGIALLLKRYFSYRANLNMVQNIHIGLEDQNQNINDNNVMYCHNFNNESYNPPFLSCFETNILFSLAVAMVALLLLPLFIKIDKTDIHVMFFYVEVTMEYIVGMVFPFYIMVKKESVRNYFWNEIPSQFC